MFDCCQFIYFVGSCPIQLVLNSPHVLTLCTHHMHSLSGIAATDKLDESQLGDYSLSAALRIYYSVTEKFAVSRHHELVENTTRSLVDEWRKLLNMEKSIFSQVIVENVVVPYYVNLELNVWTNNTMELLLVKNYLSDEFQTDLRRILLGEEGDSNSMMIEDILMNTTYYINTDNVKVSSDSYDGLYSDATIWGIPVEALVVFCVFECCCLAVCIGFVCGYLRGKMDKRQRLKSFSDKLARALHISAANTTTHKLKPPSPPFGDTLDQEQWHLRNHKIGQVQMALERERAQSQISLTNRSMTIQNVMEVLNEDLAMGTGTVNTGVTPHMTPAGPMAKTGNGSPEPPDLPPPTESTSNSKSTSVQTVASVASGATSPSLTSLLCHRHPTAPPSRNTTAPPSRYKSLDFDILLFDT